MIGRADIEGSKSDVAMSARRSGNAPAWSVLRESTRETVSGIGQSAADPGKAARVALGSSTHAKMWVGQRQAGRLKVRATPTREGDPA